MRQNSTTVRRQRVAAHLGLYEVIRVVCWVRYIKVRIRVIGDRDLRSIRTVGYKNCKVRSIRVMSVITYWYQTVRT